jgi:hypothetical protein
LAQTPAAKHLPGFGKLDLEEKDEAVTNIKKNGARLAAHHKS